MPAMTKPILLITAEGNRRHLTKAEITMRENAESALFTGATIKENKEVKVNLVAHKEFIRLKKLLRSIQKDDDLYGNIINTHCLLYAECKEFEEMKIKLCNDLEELNKVYKNKEIDFIVYSDQKNKLLDKVFTCDKKVMEKRKMILDISKENIMTIQSALRSIPKKAKNGVDVHADMFGDG